MPYVTVLVSPNIIFQTLGEEYSSLVEVDSSKIKLPSKFQRVLATAALCYGPLVMKKSIHKLDKALDENITFRQESKAVLKDILKLLEV